jgi:hypothetical protein
MATRFNPSGSVSFDLVRGRVDCGGEHVLVPADALVDLCRAAGDEAVSDFGRRLGTAIGRRIADRLGDSAMSASLEDILDHRGGELALLGLGSLGLERWGRALVLLVEGGPFGQQLDRLLGAVLEGAIQRAFGRDSRAVKLIRDDRQVRFLIANAASASRVNEWLGSGLSYGDALTRLQQNNSGMS